LTEDDTLLIFYSGHGYWDERLKTGFWLPSDATEKSRADWLSNGTISNYIGGIQCQHSLLIADACFSGSIFKTREAFDTLSEEDPVDQPESIKRIYGLPSRRAITSGAMETVPDRSVFLDFLIKKLRRSQSKYLLAEKLYIEMKEAVINNSPTQQAPLYGTIQQAGDEGGDFIFVRK
jgi:hypothetical protein